MQPNSRASRTQRDSVQKPMTYTLVGCGDRQGAISWRRGKPLIQWRRCHEAGADGDPKGEGLGYRGCSEGSAVGSYQSVGSEYAQSHDVALRPRAEKIVALENVEVEPLPVKKAGSVAKGKKVA